jgi:hypothetical protein
MRLETKTTPIIRMWIDCSSGITQLTVFTVRLASVDSSQLAN